MNNNTKKLKVFSEYIHLYDGKGKPKINFQEMYKLFPGFEFIASTDFGSYRNFGKAFEQKVYDMVVTYEGKSVFMTYREYQDTDENLAYTS